MSDERRLENRVQRGKDGMVQNAVPNRRFVDGALFGVADRERRVWAVPVCACGQITVKGKNMFFELRFEFLDILP